MFLKYYFLLSLFVDGEPSLDFLWLSTGPDVSALRLTAFLSIFDCPEFSDLYGVIEDSLLAALCLITYIVLQVVSAWLSDKFIEVLFKISITSCNRIKQTEKMSDHFIFTPHSWHINHKIKK